jgi:6-phosphogluconolactonase
LTNARRVLVHPDKETLAGSLAARFITKVVDLLDQQAEVNVVLTGGTVGAAVLSAINESSARDSIDWSRVVVWWGDERWLPRGDAERNDTQSRAALLDSVNLRPENIPAST